MSAEECCGQHVAAVVAGGERIDWDPERPRADRVRVRAYTCDCEPVFYEFCHAAGLYFIRRTSREAGRTVVHESPWMLHRKAEDLWLLLVDGAAR